MREVHNDNMHCLGCTVNYPRRCHCGGVVHGELEFNTDGQPYVNKQCACGNPRVLRVGEELCTTPA